MYNISAPVYDGKKAIWMIWLIRCVHWLETFARKSCLKGVTDAVSFSTHKRASYKLNTIRCNRRHHTPLFFRHQSATFFFCCISIWYEYDIDTIWIWYRYDMNMIWYKSQERPPCDIPPIIRQPVKDPNMLLVPVHQVLCVNLRILSRIYIPHYDYTWTVPNPWHEQRVLYQYVLYQCCTSITSITY